MPKPNRPNLDRPKPAKPNRDDEGPRDDDDGGGPLASINAAVSARWRGAEPTESELEACREQASQDTERQLHCWNGKRSDRPECKFVGSQNIPFYARCGIADWPWVAGVCRVEREEGNFGRENGSDSNYYYQGIVGAKHLAQRELLALGRNDDAEDVRRAIRSNLSWDVIAAIPAPRLRDVVNEAGEERTVEARKVKVQITVAVSGNRYTVKERGGEARLSTDNSHSITLANEMARDDGLGLTPDEVATMQAAIQGDVDAARTVAGFMFGTIQTPDTAWRWRLRRTTEGAESIYFGPFPNPNKPIRTVGQAFLDCTYRTMKPSPRGVRKGFATDYQVNIENGMIVAHCKIGDASMPELGGNLLWQVDVEGSDVRFTAG